MSNYVPLLNTSCCSKLASAFTNWNYSETTCSKRKFSFVSYMCCYTTYVELIFRSKLITFLILNTSLSGAHSSRFASKRERQKSMRIVCSRNQSASRGGGAAGGPVGGGASATRVRHLLKAADAIELLVVT